MKERERQWHDELSDLISEEANAQLSRARQRRMRSRARREAKEQVREAKVELREGLRRDELDAQMARLAAKELERKYSGLGTLPLAIVMLLATLALVGVVVASPNLFPLLFAAFGLGMGAAAIYGDYSKSRALLTRLQVLGIEGGAPTVAGSVVPQGAEAGRSGAFVPDALEQRIEEACRRLEEALDKSPKQVREFLSMPPKKTLEALRASARDFQQRERALRAMSAPEVRARVQADEDALQARIDQASDEGVRSSLFQARAALLQRRSHLDELQRSADRLEAERMRLSYTLEGLLAQVLRIQYSDGALAADELPLGLREGLEKLHGELSALADASEEVGRIEEGSPFEPIADFGGDATGRSSRLPGARERS